MKSYGVAIAVITGTCALALGVRVIHSQGKASPGTVQVHLVVTDQGLNDTNEIPVLRAEDIQVKQGKNVLKVEQLIPARPLETTSMTFEISSMLSRNPQWWVSLTCPTRRSRSPRISPSIMLPQPKRFAFRGGRCQPWIVPIYP